jgi:hypothetical protein
VTEGVTNILGFGARLYELQALESLIRSDDETSMSPSHEARLETSVRYWMYCKKDFGIQYRRPDVRNLRLESRRYR